VPPAAWPADALPQHLRPRVEILTEDRKTVGAGRDLHDLRKQLQQVKPPPESQEPAWTRAAQSWERFSLRSWSFGDLPERFTVAENGPVYAWPGLQVEDDGVSLRLFRTAETARRASLEGVRRLVEFELQKDFAWLQKDLRALARFELLLAGLCSVEQLQTTAFENLKRYLLPQQPLPTLGEAHFRSAVAQARQRLPGLASTIVDQIEAILKSRHEILRRFGARRAPAPSKPRTLADLPQLGLRDSARPTHSCLAEKELESLLPGCFLQSVPFERLRHLPRYLKALSTRCERAALNPVKDQERARQLGLYEEKLRQLSSTEARTGRYGELREELRWLIEEYKVSLFAQELGTAVPVSPKRLDQHLEHLRQEA